MVVAGLRLRTTVGGKDVAKGGAGSNSGHAESNGETVAYGEEG